MTPAILNVQSVTLHKGYVRAAMIAFKYREEVAALPILVHALRQLPRPQGCYAKNSVLLATPTTSSRLANRGFDPTGVLAYYLSKHWDIPLWRGVKRVDDTVRQQGLDRRERRQNIENAFAIQQKPPAKRVLLFDDVMTTGATLSELAQTLKRMHPEIKLSAYTITRTK